MKNKWISPLYAFNIVIQALFDLCTPIALGFFAAYLLERKGGVGGWIYAVPILLGVGVGLFTMCKFILRSMAALERLEKQNRSDEDERERAKRKNGNHHDRNE